MNHYPKHIGDYLRDTVHLSMLEDGAYNRLIDVYYSREKPLPKDIDQCYRLARALTKDEKKAVTTVLNEFFNLKDDGFHKNRCDSEIKKYQDKANKNRENGNKGGRPKTQYEPKIKPNGLDIENQKKPTGIILGSENKTQTEPKNNLNQEPLTKNQEPLNNIKHASACSSTSNEVNAKPPDDNQFENNEHVSNKAVVEPAGTSEKIPPCPFEQIVSVYHEQMPTNPRIKALSDRRKSHIRQRWREVWMDQKFENIDNGIDYFKGLFEHCASSKFLTGQVKPNGERRPFVADLEWLMLPNNFLKVIEGRYHE